jgi:hypothetical protein
MQQTEWAAGATGAGKKRAAVVAAPRRCGPPRRARTCLLPAFAALRVGEFLGDQRATYLALVLCSTLGMLVVPPRLCVGPADAERARRLHAACDPLGVSLEVWLGPVPHDDFYHELHVSKAVIWGANACVSGCTRLDLSRLTDLWIVFDGLLSALPPLLAAATKLARLRLSKCENLVDLAPLAGLVALEELTLSGCPMLADLAPLAGLKALEELTLSGCPMLTDLAPLAGLKALKTLRAYGCAKLRDLAPLAGLEALKTLEVSGCSKLRDLAPLAGLKALKTLKLAHCPVLVDLAPLAKLKGLKALDLSSCSTLRNLWPLWGLCALKTLTLLYCYKVQECDLSAVSHLPELKELKLWEEDPPDACGAN